MYQQMTYYRRPRKFGSYFLPFLSLIILGLIVVLIFQIVGYFQEKRQQELENKAAVTIAAGKAEMKLWGVDQWTNAFNGSLLHEGDIMRTLPGSRVVLTLLNGSVARLGSETEIELTSLKTRDGQDEVSLLLNSGQIWMKRSEKKEVLATFQVETTNLKVTSLGTVFTVTKGDRQSISVLDGKVQVAVQVPEEEGSTKFRIADTLDVAFGQEISLGATEIRDLQNRKSPQLLVLLSDELRNSDWYTWNRTLDNNIGQDNTQVSVEDAVNNKDATVGELTTSIDTAPSTEEQAPKELPQELSAPVVLAPTPDAARRTKNPQVVVTGTVSALTNKIEVTTYLGGKKEPYLLQKYVSGSKNWSYVVSKSYGNLLPGENKYSIVAIGKDGQRSAATELTLFYDQPKEPADLSAPKVLSYNGGTSPEVSENSVTVVGSVGKGIVKVFVNDLPLTRYVPDSGSWTYYAKTEYGNLKEGVNTYAVHGLDAEGNKTPVMSFVITKKAVTEPAPTPTPTPKPEPEPQPISSPVL